jgi:hypothetical protein
MVTVRKSVQHAVVVEQHRLLARADVVDLQVEIFARLSQDTAHQVGHAERQEHETGQRLAPLGHRCQRHSALVHRHVKYEARRRFLVAPYHEFSRGERLAAVARALDRGTPDRIGIHVEAEGLEVAALERFGVDHGHVAVALAFRAHVVVGKAFRTHARHVLGERVAGNEFRVVHTAHAGIGLADAQLGHVVAPFYASNIIARREQPGAAAQHLLVAAHARLNRFDRRVDHAIELRAQRVLDRDRCDAPAEQGSRERDGEHDQRRPEIPQVRSLRQAAQQRHVEGLPHAPALPIARVKLFTFCRDERRSSSSPAPVYALERNVETRGGRAVDTAGRMARGFQLSGCATCLRYAGRCFRRS